MIVIIAAVVTGWLGGGRLSNLSVIPLRKQELMILALLLQAALNVGGSSGPRWLPAVAPTIHILSYLLLFYVIYDQLHIPGMRAAGAGIGLNFLVIAANGGRMPAQFERIMATESQWHSLTHVLLDSQTHLAWLGDVMYLSWPRQMLFSIGDVLVWSGVFWLVASGMRRAAVAPSSPEC